MTLHYGIAAHRNVDETGTEPLDDRKNVEGLFVRGGAIRRGTDALVAGSAGWTFTLNAAWYVTQRAAGDGFQLWGNDGAITLSTNAAGATLPTSAPAAGLSRYYRAWVRHRSNGENSDTTSIPDAGVEFSSASSSPTLPALPVGATEVATSLMDSTATSTASSGNTLVQTMPWTAARGGVVPCRSEGELTTLAALGSALTPFLASLSGDLYVCRGGAARLVDGDTGWVTPTFGSGFESVGPDDLVRVRKVGNIVYLKGYLKPTSGSFSASSTAGGIITVPVGFRPANRFSAPVALPPLSIVSPASVVVNTSGAVDLRTGPTDTPAYVSLGGISWPVG